jgi:hypothetical protein
MAEDLTTAQVNDVPTGDASVQPAISPQSGEDVTALKNAYLRTKEELVIAKEQIKEQLKRATILDQIEAGGITLDQLPARLAALREAQAADERIAALRSEMEKQAADKLLDIQQQHNNQVAALNKYLRMESRKASLDNLFLSGGGSAQSPSDVNAFRKLAEEYIEFEDDPIRDINGQVVGFQAKIKGFKDAEGNPLYVDDAKQIGKMREGDLNDFLIGVKQGLYGQAIQILLPAFNRSTGSNIPSAGGVGSFTQMTRAEMAERMGKMSELENKEFLQAIADKRIVITG